MTTLAELLAPLWDGDNAALVAVVGDRLEEMNRLDLKRILAGTCESCGGELWYRARRTYGAPGGWLPECSFWDAVSSNNRSGLSYGPECAACGEEDVEATPSRAAILRRVYRKLGLAIPPRNAEQP